MNEDRSNEPLDKAAETAARNVRAAGQTEKIAHAMVKRVRKEWDYLE